MADVPPPDFQKWFEVLYKKKNDEFRETFDEFFSRTRSYLEYQEDRALWVIPFIKNTAAECLNFLTRKEPVLRSCPYVFRTGKFDPIIKLGKETTPSLVMVRETLDRVLMQRHQVTHSPDVESLKKKIEDCNRLISEVPVIHDLVVDELFVLKHASVFFVNLEEFKMQQAGQQQHHATTVRSARGDKRGGRVLVSSRGKR